MNAENETVGAVGANYGRDYETKEQLADRLGVSSRTIDNLIVRGLPHIKITRKLVRFPRAAVNAWLTTYEIRR
jgi:excisionase family DNA binding protein